MAQFAKNLLMYQSFDLDWNKIGSEGCKYLSQASWVSLIFIDLRIISPM
jgi:hypothetical protein